MQRRSFLSSTAAAVATKLPILDDESVRTIAAMRPPKRARPLIAMTSLKSLFFALTLLLAGCAQGLPLLPHHDHTSRRSGLVLMDGDTHFEVVVGFDGRHVVLFSDAYRNPLAQTDIAEASLEILREGAPAEMLALRPDAEQGTWSASGTAIEVDEIMVRFSYRKPDAKEAYSIDLPASKHPHSHAH